jgi:hypothetical protein
MAIALPRLALPPLRTLSRRAGAWWNGEAYVESDESSEGAATAKSDTPGTVAPAKPDAVKFIAPNAGTDPRIIATSAIWGAGRFGPGTLESDTVQATLLGLNKQSTLYLVGGAGGRSALDVHLKLGTFCKVFDWREGALDAVKALAKAGKKERAIAAIPFGFEEPIGDKGKADLLLFADALHAAPDPIATLKIAAKSMKKTGQIACVELIARDPECTELTQARNDVWGERKFFNEDALLNHFEKAGFSARANDDVSATLLDLITVGRITVREGGEELLSSVAKAGGPAALNAFLYDLYVWRARAEALRCGKLTARRLVFAPK